jgi:predicted AAA+ superfamily ATPase
MSHFRVRFAEKILIKDMSFSPCVAVVGMRQVGKSTLLKGVAKQYNTFDDEVFLGEFQRNSRSLLVTPPFPMAIDEIQKYAPAFDALKFAVDNHRVPGRFLISGSVRFASRKNIRESLAGRVVTINLLPMTLAECHQRPLSKFVEITHQKTPKSLAQIIAKSQWATETHLRHYSQRGGLPGICFARDPAVCRRYFEAHLDTLFARDIHLIRRTNLGVTTLIGLLKEIERRQGLALNMAELARGANTSIPTVKETLAAFEGLFLIRPYGQTYYVEDLGLGYSLCNEPLELSRKTLIKILFHELRSQINYASRVFVQMKPYKTRGGVDVPFVIEASDQSRVAIGVDDGAIPSEKTLKGLTWFCKRYPKAKVLVLCRRKDAVTTANGIACLPWTWVF